MMSSQLTRVYASAAVLALGATVLAPVAAQASDPQHGTIEQRNNATITIHKMEAGSLRTAGVTADTPNAEGDGVQGVPFKLFRLKLDLTTSADWQKLQGLDVGENACTATGEPNFDALAQIDRDESVTEQQVTTGGNGAATATVSTGAYLVCEQPSPNAKNKDGHAVTVVKKAKAFVATVPTPHPNGQGWLYDLHVYPKNTVVEAPVKTVTVTEPGLKRDKGVTVEIATKVPSLAADEHFKHFAVADPMPAQMTNPSDVKVSIDSVGLNFTQTTDFSVTEGNSNTFVVSFTKTGLAKLRNQKNQTVKVSFKATMNTLPADGQANNAAWVYVGKQNTEITDETPTLPIVYPTTVGGEPTSTDPTNPPQRTKNTVGMTWGKFTIEKVDAARSETKLAKATFKLYVAQNQQTCDQSNLETTGDAISVGTANEFTTGTNGQVTIEGVHLHTKSVDGANPDPTRTRCFIIEETVAPAGYILPQTAKTAVLVNADTPDQVARVTNTQIKDLPNLPLTGAAGQVLLMLAGSALMLASVGAFMVLRKRQAKRA